MSLDLETVPETAVQGDLLEAAASPSRSACRTSCPSSATSCSTRSTAPILRSTPARCGASATDPRHAQAQAVPGASRCGPCRHRAVGRSWRTRRDRQWRDGLRQDDRRHRHGRRAQRRGLPPHPGALATHLVYKWRRENQETVAGARSGCWPGHAGQAAETARAVGRAGPGPGVLRPGPRADADGVPLEACLRSAAHASRRRGGLPGLRACHHRPRRRADQPGRARSRGPPQVQPLPCTAVVVDPSQRPVRQRPVLDRAQGTEAHSTIGEVTAQKLMQKFGDAFLASMLGDNIHEFINLMDGNGELVFSDRQAHRMERAMANMEFGFGEGGYQPSGVHQGSFPRHVRPAHRRRGARVQERRLRTGPGHGVLAARRARRCCSPAH